VFVELTVKRENVFLDVARPGLRSIQNAVYSGSL
jgi:hypothetical protein